MSEFQSHFMTTISPAHTGHQDFLHQDVHYHLANPNDQLIGRPFYQDNHRPLFGQTTLNDFSTIPQKLNGLW